MSKTVAVFGSRTYGNLPQIAVILKQLASKGEFEIVTGDTKGADDAVSKWCEENSIKCRRVQSDWESGDDANLKRNAALIDTAELAIAFWDGVSDGTLDLIVRAKKKKVDKKPISVLVFLA